MPIKLVNIALIDDETIMVEFSDERYSAFTVAELLSLESLKKTQQPSARSNLIS